MLNKVPKAAADRPAVGYVRRSTDKQEQSLDDQKKAIEHYAANHHLTILRFYTDDAISGTSSENRPGFQQMIAAASNGHRDFSAILCYDVKRFGRTDSDEAGHYRFLLRQSGVEVIYTSEGFTGHDTDEIVRTVKQLQARQESKDLSKVTLRGQLSSINSGSYLGGTPPYGYDYRYVDSKGTPVQIVRFNEKGEKLLLHPETRELFRIIPQGEPLGSSKEDRLQLVPSTPERVAVLQRIFRDYQAGDGYRAIANRLNAEGVPSPRSREWHAQFDCRWGLSTIRSILVNPVYAGDTVWNRLTQAKFHRSSARGVIERRGPGKRVRDPNPREDWVITPDTHEPLISRATFNEAQRLRLQRDAAGHQSGRPRGRGYYSNYLLTGLIRCGNCGHKFQGYVHKSRSCYKDPTLERPRYYLCGGYVTKGTAVCKRRAYPQDSLETYVLGRLQARLEVFLNQGGETAMRQLIREAIAEAGPNPKQALPAVQSEIALLRKDVDRLLENLTPGNRDFVDEKLGQIRRRLRDLEHQEDDLRSRVKQTPDIEATVAAALAQVRRFRDVLACGTIVEQKTFLHGFIAGITITPTKDEGVITWYSLPASLMFGGGSRPKLYRRMRAYGIPRDFGRHRDRAMAILRPHDA